jgi:RNase P subunit RPR2
MKVDKQELGRTICASCKKGKLVSAPMWNNTATYWYCILCGHINRWIRNR